ncbi:MAG: hypothetical protein RMY36_024410 [Nostoc sp. SerVER01]|nr:hypothetical protein [Nostoc sp. SerVER01]
MFNKQLNQCLGWLKKKGLFKFFKQPGIRWFGLLFIMGLGLSLAIIVQYLVKKLL